MALTENFDLSRVAPAEDYLADPREDGEECRGLVEEATTYLQGFSWCEEIQQLYVGLCYPGIIGIFLAHIRPAHAGFDEWIWVVVGDIPPAYLVTDDAPDPGSALDAYIRDMEQWVTRVREGRSVDDVIPVNAPTTIEFADMLGSRLDFLRRKILSD